MREYETLGHQTFQGNLENDNSVPNCSYFLPHIAIIRDSVITKCRVVVDAIAKESNIQGKYIRLTLYRLF